MCLCRNKEVSHCSDWIYAELSGSSIPHVYHIISCFRVCFFSTLFFLLSFLSINCSPNGVKFMNVSLMVGICIQSGGVHVNIAFKPNPNLLLSTVELQSAISSDISYAKSLSTLLYSVSI